ncbi:MAG: hypothetical protein EBT80_03950 [Chitinophagales bacterium]|nr:hypothetical protein [Chitinophagales bacterium]
MKRIRTLQDLEYEKMRIRLQRLEQEKSIRQDWDALKLSVAATLLLRNTIDRMTDEKTTPPGWFTGLLQVGTAALGEKVGQLTAQKIETTLNGALRLALETWRKNRKT